MTLLLFALLWALPCLGDPPPLPEVPACHRWLAQITDLDGPVVEPAKSVTAEQYTSARAALDTERTRLQKEEEVLDEHLPYVLDHGQPTKNVIVLVHGLSESPKGMLPLAELYHSLGYNVVSVTLKGHGSKPEAMHKATAEQWQADISRAVEAAEGMGDNVVISGFSLGAHLARWYDHQHPGRIKGMVLHSASIAIQPRIKQHLEQKWERLNEVEPEKWEEHKDIWAEPDPETLPDFIEGGYAYARTSIPAYRQVSDFVDGLAKADAEKPSTAPRALVFSERDAAMDVKALVSYASENKVPDNLQLIIPRAARGQHTDPIRPNPEKPNLTGPEVREFLKSAVEGMVADQEEG